MKKIFNTLMTLFFILCLALLIIVNRSIKPYRMLRQDAFRHAEDYVELQTRENFYIYNGSEGSYLTVTGHLDNGQHVVAVINQANGQIDLFQADQIINEEEAIRLFQEAMPEAEFKQARIGKDDHFVWEISYENPDHSLGYYYMNLENGQWIRTLDHL